MTSYTDQDHEFLKGLTLLYVEDDLDAREQLCQFLKRRCARLVCADNGAHGVETFRAEQPDIVITDILMPELDGLDMAVQIRRISPTVPIIVTTAFEQTDYLLRSIEIGIDRYVTKPVHTERLYAALLECSHHMRAERQLERQRLEEARLKHLEAMAILAGGMAHDFNNLLQVIMGYVSLAKLNCDPAGKIYQFLDIAERSSVQARELGQRLLVLSRDNDAFAHDTPIGPLIRDTVNAVLDGRDIHDDMVTAGPVPAMAPVKLLDPGVNRRFALPDDLPPVRIDRWRIRQVFGCLTHNAVEAMPSGGNLRVSAETCMVSDAGDAQLKPGHYIHVTFSDDGIGIPAENLPRIFEPYFTTKEIGSKKGTGLSLALCHAIVRKHKGMITAESLPGNGTHIHVYLPVHEEEGP